MSDYSEDSLVEQPAIELLSKLGWQTANCFYEKFGENGTLGRKTSSVVVLVPRLRAALVRLNPDLPSEAIDLAIEELTRDRSVISPANANREVYILLKNGVKVSFRGIENEEPPVPWCLLAGAGAVTEEQVQAEDGKHLQQLLREEKTKDVFGETSSFCSGLGIDLTKIQNVYAFERIRLIDEAVDAILVNDESKRKFMSLAGSIVRIYRSILPDPAAA
jgi:hypothetical protein